jgi:hypothetical protein
MSILLSAIVTLMDMLLLWANQLEFRSVRFKIMKALRRIAHLIETTLTST